MANTDQMGLFQNASESHQKEASGSSPLAYRVRPGNLEGYFGQEALFKRYPRLREGQFGSLILWGLPGVGKTTLAEILASMSGKTLYRFNAVLGGVNDLKKIIKELMDQKMMFQKEAIIFIDEIHRFNKAQQDALLPHVERGDFHLIGATTENPRQAVNKALLSRLQTLELKPLSHQDLEQIVSKAAEKCHLKIDEEMIQFIADHSGGDARKALNTLEIVEREYLYSGELPSQEVVKKQLLENARDYDKNKDRHYDVISAFIKSLRGSDPNAALYWLAVMIDGGEDPVFIARRLVIFASEDVGNADPMALNLAVSCMTAVSQIGMPEARINLAQATTYLASTVKSNAAYLSIDRALEFIREKETLPVPDHLKNFPPKDAKPYQYPHAFEGHFVKQDYTVEEIPAFYQPGNLGTEANIKKRLASLHPEKYSTHE